MSSKTHIYIIKVYIPVHKNPKENKKIRESTISLYSDYLKSNDTIYTNTQIKYIFKKKYPTIEKWLPYSFCMDVTEKQLQNAISAESLDMLSDNIKPSNRCLPKQSYILLDELHTCPICLQSNKQMQMVYMRKCKCIFHRECIKKSFQYNTHCPICTKRLVRVNKEPICK